MNYDVVIVLANEMDANGVLNYESSLRAGLAAKLMSELSVPYVITCGWAYRDDSKIKIADAFKLHLIALGIDSTKIITETKSRDTVGDAVFTRANILEPMGFKKLCVVTSEYHVSRVRKIFEFVYGAAFEISVRGVDVEFDESVMGKELHSEAAFYNTFNNVEVGNLGQILHALKNKHPFYNGKIYSKI